MDPISITTSILSSLLTIKAWIDARDKKDKAIKDLSTTINLVHLILSPLSDTQRACTLHPSIVASLLSIGEVLSRIKDHLSIWKDTSNPTWRFGRVSLEKVLGFISPAGVVGDLRDDAALLAQHVQTVSFAMQVSTFLAGQEREKEREKSPPPTPVRREFPPSVVPKESPPPEVPRSSLLALIKNEDVRSFWKDMVGENTLYVPRTDFHRTISKWLSDNFSEAFMDALILRIDEFGVGGVTPSGLDRFVGERLSLREVVYELKDRPRILANQHVDCAKCQNDSTPWLVWVDDTPDNNENEVESARASGIEVFQFNSTASAKAWIVANEAELRLKEASRLLRFITDNTRWETDNDNNPHQTEQEQDFLNISAGEQILRFLRGRQYRSPVLVYCCFSIELTRYVSAYERAGSTTWMNLCLAFIGALARGEVDDEEWEGYQAEVRMGLLGVAGGSVGGGTVSSTRLKRFGDEASTSLLFGVGPAVRATSIAPNRVDEMQLAVRYIRKNWWNYPIFLHDLCSSLLDAVGPSLLSEVFHSRREWANGRETTADRSEQSYGLIRLYTTEIGYNRLVEILSDVFQSDDITQTSTNGIRLQSSVFLKELLSIELYNHRNLLAFTGIVYRGLCLSLVYLGDIRTLIGSDVMQRVWDMPWSVLSCTENVADALNYVQRDAATAATASRRAVLWRIQVAEMEEELLGIYRARFPSAVIGAFGATSIKDLSLHPQENEVILLGCHCQVVRMETVHMRLGGMMDIIDGVVLNTSIDHPSTTDLGEEEERAARGLFDRLCAIELARICSRLAEGCGLEKDAFAYREYYQEEYLKL